VVCVDNDAAKVKTLRQGEIPIYEPGLNELVPRNVTEERLRFTTDLPEAVRASEVLFIAVGTPQDEDGSADLKHVLEVAREIGRAMNGFKILVNKSTVPVGTAARVREVVSALTSHPFAIVSNPEFLKEGTAVDDFLKPDRVVIGTDDPKVEQTMRQLYEPFVRTGNPILVMDHASAELTKYAANAMLATRISFMNEIAGLCDRLGADVGQVRLGLGRDARIGSSFLFPGVGYGGSCFPKDTEALVKIGQLVGADMRIVRAAISVNQERPQLALQKLEHLLGSVEGRTIALLGIAFKPNTDDIREAPALKIASALREKGASVRGYDPIAMERVRAAAPEIAICASAYEAASGADAVILCTEWNEFRDLNLARLKEVLRQAVLVDCRNIYDRDKVEALGFKYACFGR